MTMTYVSAPTTLAQLVARSRKLGADRSVCNWGGGNTSAKSLETDFRGYPVRVLWVKGSGSDLASVTEASFTGLYLDDVMPLLERERMSDTDMVNYLAHCFYEPGRPRPSIETLLHGFLPFPHIDHTHADATNYLACAKDGEALARDCFGDALIWIPYRRPGFGLAREVALAFRAKPHAKLVILAKHGLITWGENDESCYASTMATITQARTYVEARIARADKALFGGFRVTPLDADERRRVAAQVAPVMRGLVSAEKHQILRFEESEDVLAFASSQDAATPVYRAADATADPHPRVILIPGVGMFTTGKDALMADVSAQLTHRSIDVMHGAEACGGFISLSDAESYAVEYWPLEQYKLKQAPPEREFSRHVVLVTGAAGGIGSAICRHVAQDGAHLVATDIDRNSAEELATHLNKQFGAGRAVAVKMDVTNEESVRTAFVQAKLAFGGIDVIVNNAGLASSASITETTLSEWNKNWNVLATGYFLVAREGFRLLEAQGRGGNLVFVASKNALVAGKNAAAYSTAKAAEVHLARCLAEEGGQFGIRVNTVNPDAVLAGSRIWDSTWRQERAATYGVAPDQLEEVYRKRTTLGVNILPEDIAEAVAFFASPTRSTKSTGNILNVDGGVAAAYPR